jgi:predicted nucleic acid-binding protein
MKRILLDVNVVRDVLLGRHPHAEASAAIGNLIETGRSAGFLAAHAFTTIHYLIRQDVALSRAKH